MASKVIKRVANFHSEPLGAFHLLASKLLSLVMVGTLKICLKKGKLPKIKYIRKTCVKGIADIGLPMVGLLVVTHLASQYISPTAVQPIKISFVLLKAWFNTSPLIKKQSQSAKKGNSQTHGKPKPSDTSNNETRAVESKSSFLSNEGIVL